MTMRTLHCQAGNHEWQRPAQRGRTPINCPEHTEVKETNGERLSGLEAAHAARASKKSQEEKIWAEKVDAVINDPRMIITEHNYSYAGDARRETVRKLQYIQDQLTNHKHRPQNELSDLERMRDKIMKDPFNRTGHLL